MSFLDSNNPLATREMGHLWDGGHGPQSIAGIRQRFASAGDTARSESGSGSRSESWHLRSEWRPESGQSQARVGPESALEPTASRILQILTRGALSRAEISKALGHTQVSGGLKRAIKTLMDEKLIEYTIPEKPNSRLQKYRLATNAPSRSSDKRAINAPNAPRGGSEKRKRRTGEKGKEGG